MKAFGFLASSKKKKENRDTTRARQMRGESASSAQFHHRPSLESFCSPDRESFVGRITGRRAFSSSTPHLLSTPAQEPLLRKPSVFRRPRFTIFRDTTPSPAPPPTPPAPHSSLSYGTQEPSSPDLMQDLMQPSSTRRAMVIPPMPPFPQDIAQMCVKRVPSSAVLHPPREPLPVPPPSRSRAEARAVLRSATRAEAATRRRSKSATAGSRTGTQAVPALDDIWHEFVCDVAGDMPQMPRLHSYDVSPTTRRAPTRPLPPPPREVPGIIVSCRPATPLAVENDEDSCNDSTPEPLGKRLSQDNVQPLVSSLRPSLFHASSDKQRTPRLGELPSPEAMQHLAPSLASGTSIATAYLHSSENSLAPQLDRQLSCSSSEVSLSLFPLPPTQSYAPPFTPCRAAIKPTLDPRIPTQYIPPPLEDSRASLDSSDPESPTSPIDMKYSSLLTGRFHPMKAQTSMESVSTVTTEEWAEISLSYSPSAVHSDMRSPWSDSHAVGSSYDYAGAVAVSERIQPLETAKGFIS